MDDKEMLFFWRAVHPFHQPKEAFTQTKQNAGYIYATKSDSLEHVPHNFPVSLFFLHINARAAQQQTWAS